ncbi:hypothetical protein Anas_10598 [Armadillidium nasatum]|uniref:39S ribosomal protein L1, mitochondrial n=1 Tax=Armadillidium nasatum TaxID=96803 RepID=A0A5N5SNC9_9CRUS|nr:hypothetical protein Anas_10598 [Armadillidium nasatum]
MLNLVWQQIKKINIWINIPIFLFCLIRMSFSIIVTILAICKDDEMIESIRNLDITLAIGPEVVRMAEKGNIDFKVYDHIVCHSSLLPDLISIRGLLKKKYPSPRTGTSGVDLVPIITRLTKGVEYKVEKDKYDFDFGKVDVKIGTVKLNADGAQESYKIDHNLYLPPEEVEEEEDDKDSKKMTA